MNPCFLDSNFMLQDLILSLVGLPFLGFFFLCPGYVLGWITNVQDFRKRSLIIRLLTGSVLSVAVLPYAAYVLWLALGDWAIWLTLACVFVFFLWLIIPEISSISLPHSGWAWAAYSFTAFWVFIAVFSLIDLQIGSRVYYSLISYDYSARIPLTDAIFRTGIPPVNPLFYPGEVVGLSYYYFWSIPSALMGRLTGGFIDPRIAFSITTVWCGIALRAIAVLYLRFLSPVGSRKIEQRAVAALLLLFITGLDIFFIVPEFIQNPGSPFVTEGWDGLYQVTSWNGATLWAPNHVASLIACLTGYMVLMSLRPRDPQRRRLLLAGLAGISFASAFGMSANVTLVFAIFGGIWWLITLIKKEWRYQASCILISGLSAILLMMPFLVGFFQNDSFLQSQIVQQSLRVRKLQPIQTWINQIGSDSGAVTAINLLLLGFDYFIELGFFIVAGLYYLRAMIRSPEGVKSVLAPGALLLTSLAIGSFIHPSVFLNNKAILNNTVVRGIMFAQFILLVWSAEVLAAILSSRLGKANSTFGVIISKKRQTFLLALLFVGFVSTSIDLFFLRFNYLINDQLEWFPVPAEGRPDRSIGSRTFDLRQAYCYIRSHYPLDAVVQHNPNVSDVERASALYGLRQTAILDSLNPAFFGVSQQELEPVFDQVIKIFEDTSIAYPQVVEICDRFKIDLLVVKDLDKGLQEPGSWTAAHQPVFQKPFARVFECRHGADLNR